MNKTHMRIPFTLLLGLCIVISFQSCLSAQTTPQVTLIKAKRLLDPRTGNSLSRVAVLIQGDRIAKVGAPTEVQAEAPDGTRILDLGGATLLPGLIDGHTHLFLNIVVPSEEEMSRHSNPLFAPGLLLAVVESPSKRALMAAQLAREDLESGITTVRNLGHSGIDGDTELRDAINTGPCSGANNLGFRTQADHAWLVPSESESRALRCHPAAGIPIDRRCGPGATGGSSE